MSFELTLPSRPTSGRFDRRRPAAGLTAVAGAGAVLVVAAAVVAASRVRRVRVLGGSMLPALEPGDRLLVVRAAGGIRPGDVVAVPDPRRPERLLIKRVTGFTATATGTGTENASVVLAGDAPGESTDSRTFGPVPAASIWGVARYRYAPADRAGRIARGAAHPGPHAG